jgi:hypothetical protein
LSVCVEPHPRAPHPPSAICRQGKEETIISWIKVCFADIIELFMEGWVCPEMGKMEESLAYRGRERKHFT